MLRQLVFPFTGNGWLATPRRFAIAVLSMGVPSTVMVYLRDPSTASNQFFSCMWLVITGGFCPGCGMTRAVHDLMHGRLLQAIDHNAFGIVLLAFIATIAIKPMWLALTRNTWRSPAIPEPVIYTLAASLLLWWILRNLPWAPFIALAP